MSAVEEAQPEDSPESVTVQYDQRWTWLKLVLAQPKEVLSAGTKVVLTVIFEAVDKKTGITKRYQEALAKDAGDMTVRGVQKCIEKAVAAGFIIVEHRGGGIVWDDAGNANGLPCHYRMSLPRTAVRGNSQSTPNSGSRQPEQEGETVRTPVADTPNGGSYNTPFSSPISPPSSPQRARRDSFLPEAPMEIRAAWGDRWPDSEKTIMRYDDLNNALRCVGTEAMRLLGWTMDEARMPEGSEFKYRDAWLNAQIPPDEHRELALQMHAGRLKAVTLANVLAFHGLQPKEDRRAA